MVEIDTQPTFEKSFRFVTVHDRHDLRFTFPNIMMNSQPATDLQNISPEPSQLSGTDYELLMRQCVFSHMREGVVCVDRQLRVTSWNSAVETMTGLNTSAMIGNTITPGVFRLVDATIGSVTDANCPFLRCLSGESFQRSYQITGRSGREVEIEFTFHPIRSTNGQVLGAVALLHDDSAQMDLQRQLNDLYMMAILDPLTQVANRAEFERLLDDYVRSHHDANLKCSIIICDIDFFKGINDNYGHHIGDQALIAFAQLLKQFVRKNDFVARYGGEEFVILCGNCDEEAAVQRAEDIRFRLEKTPQSMLNGKCMTASFGVSQLEDDDDSTTFFVRADHAMLKAKEMGRNRVVRADAAAIVDDEVGSGADQSVSGVKWRRLKGDKLINMEFRTKTPINVLIEKMRCLIPEIGGAITSASENHVSLTCEVADPERPTHLTAFNVEVDLRKVDPSEKIYDGSATTYMRIIIQRGRSGWFQRTNDKLAESVLRNLRQYLTLTDESCVVKVDAAVTSSGREDH